MGSVVSWSAAATEKEPGGWAKERENERCQHPSYFGAAKEVLKVEYVNECRYEEHQGQDGDSQDHKLPCVRNKRIRAFDG